MESLETDLDRARRLDVGEIADAIESIGFECTRCGACCKGYDPRDEADSGGSDFEGGDAEGTDGDADACHDASEPHTATVFPGEVRRLQEATGAAFGEAYDWRDVARPMPYGLAEDSTGETFEWALQTDDCGDCTFYREGDGHGACTVHESRPLICRTYPFSLGAAVEDGDDEDSGLGMITPMGGVVDREGIVRAHECEGLGRDIAREDAEELARTLKTRVIREIEEAIGVRDNYEPIDTGRKGVVVHDSEGQKRPDGTTLDP